MEHIYKARLFYRTQYDAIALKTQKQKQKQISLENAKKFFNKHKKI